ncbi:MAG TPA: cache domain-containing protein, partial [Leptospiraceae bacterium]|nr:cache domain-containing protein [Leptospiraceae bacterium]
MANFSISSQLIDATSKIVNILRQIKEINSTTKLIAINAAIESSRSAQLSDNFSALSEQVRTLSTRSEESFTEIQSLIDSLRIYCAKAIAVRLADLSIDLIDKIDRNLFERNCDCQAWASFKDNVNACLSGNGETSIPLLKNLVEVYQVYHDIFLLNIDGTVIGAGKNLSLIGESQKERTWFKEVIRTDSVYVSDMYYSESVKNFTVSYSAPVRDENRNLIGVLSSRFNWDFISDIIEKVKLEKHCRIFLISDAGTVISSKQKYDILRDNMIWLEAGESCIQGKRGYSIETSRNGQWKAYGFARTKGYNAYQGKGWSVIVDEPIFLENPRVLVETFAEHSEKSFEKKARAHSEDSNNQLLQVTHQLGESIESINKINNVTTTLALNAAIRADRAGDQGRAFSVLAEEVRAFSQKSDQLTEEINSTLDSLNQVVRETVSTRLADAAFDTIDKVDRNLFERHCDVQAWTTFEEVIECAEKGTGKERTSALLKDLHQIYEVYYDIYLLNQKGVICAAAIRQDLIGQDQSDRDWFQQAVQGNVSFTDMYKSDTAGAYTVSYCAPVKNKKGQIVGVLTTRFNWNFAVDIINASLVYSDCKVYLVNSSGLLIASTDGRDILKKDFSRFEAF